MTTAVAAPENPRPLYVLLLEEVVKAARKLPAPDLDEAGHSYHILSRDPDFIALRAALEALDAR